MMSFDSVHLQFSTCVPQNSCGLQKPILSCACSESFKQVSTALNAIGYVHTWSLADHVHKGTGGLSFVAQHILGFGVIQQYSGIAKHDQVMQSLLYFPAAVELLSFSGFFLTPERLSRTQRSVKIFFFHFTLNYKVLLHTFKE
jgi:hypothetical protein